MKLGEKGYTLIELLIAITIMALATGAAGAAIFQVLRNTERNNDHMTVVRQVQNAGYWISRDAQMAQTVSADNLTLPDFLVISWTELRAPNDAVYHSATYFFEGLTTDGIGTLKRNHWSTAGENQTSLIAQYIYCNPIDVDDTNSSKAIYDSPVLTVKLTALFEQEMESKEYKIRRRPNL